MTESEPPPQTAGRSETVALLFAVFNEIGIIEQLGRNRLEAVLPDGLCCCPISWCSTIWSGWGTTNP